MLISFLAIMTEFVIVQLGSVQFDRLISYMIIEHPLPIDRRLLLEFGHANQGRVILACTALLIRTHCNRLSSRGAIPPIAELAVSLAIALVLYPIGMAFDVRSTVLGILGLTRVNDIRTPLFLFISVWEFLYIVLAAYIVVNSASSRRHTLQRGWSVAAAILLVELSLVLMATARRYYWNEVYEAVPQLLGIAALIGIGWIMGWMVPRRYHDLGKEGQVN